MAHYYIDYENVRNIGLQGVEALTDGDAVTIFYRDTDTMQVPHVIALLNSGAAIHFTKVLRTTPNALDFQLLAELFCAADHTTVNYIISKDRGYDSAIDVARLHGIKLRRVDTIGVISLAPKPRMETSAEPVPAEEAAEEAPEEAVTEEIPAEEEALPEEETVSEAASAEEPAADTAADEDAGETEQSVEEETAAEAEASESEEDITVEIYEIETGTEDESEAEPAEPETAPEVPAAETTPVAGPEAAPAGEPAETAPAAEVLPANEPLPTKSPAKRQSRKASVRKQPKKSVKPSAAETKTDEPAAAPENAEPEVRPAAKQSKKTAAAKPSVAVIKKVRAVLTDEKISNITKEQCTMITRAAAGTDTKQRFYQYIVSNLGAEEGLKLYNQVKGCYPKFLEAVKEPEKV